MYSFREIPGFTLLSTEGINTMHSCVDQLCVYLHAARTALGFSPFTTSSIWRDGSGSTAFLIYFLDYQFDFQFNYHLDDGRCDFHHDFVRQGQA